jgi:replicative DNA helicase
MNHSETILQSQVLYDEYQDRMLGILIAESIRPGDIVLQLREEYFESGVRRNIFRAIRELRREEKPINTVTVYGKLVELKTPIDAVYLANIDNGIYHCDGWKHYRHELHLRYVGERIKECKADFLKHQDIDKLYNEMQEIRMLDPDPIATDVHQLLVSYMVEMADVMSGRRDNRITPTYHSNTDSLITGFKPSEFVLLGGRPGMGKTTLGVQFALNQAINGKPVAFFTLEMSTQQLMTRLVSNLCEVDGEAFLDVSSRISQEQYTEMGIAVDRVKNAPLHIVDIPGADPTRIELELIKLIRTHKIEGAYIDYLQLISALPEDRSKARIEQVTNISKYLKMICKRLNIWLCVVSSLSRNVEQRDNKRPQMSDLRETGQLEFDADKILFVFRPAEYMAETDPNKQELKEVMEVLVRKNRNGKVGTAMARIKLQYTKVLEFNGEIPTFEEKMLSAKAPF